MKTNANQITVHILCSIVFLLFPIFSSPDFPHLATILSNPNGSREICSHILLLGFFYLSYFVLIPRFYFRQQYALFYTWVAVSALLIFSLLFGWPGGFSLLLKTNQRWRKLQQEKLETELSYLKAQINPHFLFNTLNSIYSLAIEKSDYTATAVVKLSGMMRYIISESNKHFVSLEKEIAYISDYIELQKFRLGGTVKISYTLEGNYSGREIAPLLLITFVENAFKYGVNPEEYSAITTQLRIEGDTLTLVVENNKVRTLNGSMEASGLGISNTRHRLDRLYPGKHQLRIEEDAGKFCVHLEIMLS